MHACSAWRPAGPDNVKAMQLNHQHLVYPLVYGLRVCVWPARRIPLPHVTDFKHIERVTSISDAFMQCLAAGRALTT
jgi:hypothetical protein